MKVSVYYNLHRRMYSIRAEEGPSKGRVIGHADGVTIDNVTFTVQRAGRDRVRQTRQKNIHAFVRGFLSAAFNFEITQAGREGMLPWYLNRHHTVKGSDVFRAHELRAKSIVNQGQPFRYDPYTQDQFALLDGTPLLGAGVVHLAKGAAPVARNPVSGN